MLTSYELDNASRLGKGWDEIIDGTGVFQYHFVCRDCGGALPQGFVIAPRYCCYCGKDHEGECR